MLRNSNRAWWRRLFLQPVLINDEQTEARRCPECTSGYVAGERYCPRCHTATPEWRYG